MKKDKSLFCCFIVLALIQLAVPLYMIWRWEDVLRTGQQYTWITAPMDIQDALRGRYVDLRFKEMKGPMVGHGHLHSGQTAYAVIAKDQKGYGFISGVSATRPEGNSYVKIKVSYVQDHTIVYFMLPFTRFYMQEDLAIAAEQAYGKNANTEVTISVRIKDGYGVVEELYIGDQRIDEYLRTSYKGR